MGKKSTWKWLLGMLLCASLAEGQSPRQQRPWSDLNYYLGHEATLALPDGTDLQGRVMGVRPNELELDVTKTSSNSLHPKGRTAIPRDSIFAIGILQRVRSQTPEFPPAGPIIIGFMGGAYLGGAIGGRIGGEKGLSRGLEIGAVAGGVLGVMVGMRDRYETVTTIIEILPDRSRENTSAPTSKLPTRHAPTPKPAPDTWPVTPRSRTAADWAL